MNGTQHTYASNGVTSALHDSIFPVNNSEACLEMCAALQAAQASGKHPVLLVADTQSILPTKRFLARRECAFGTTIETLAGWARGIWELFGNGATVIEPIERRLVLTSLARPQIGTPTSGMIDVLDSCARQALYAIDNPQGLEATERALQDILQTYRKTLRANNLIELCEVYALLTKQAPVLRARYTILVLNGMDATIPVSGTTLLETLDALPFETLPLTDDTDPRISPELQAFSHLLYRRSADDAPIAATGAVRVAFAAGPSAEHRTLSHVLQEKPGSSVLFAVKQPLALFDYCCPLLQKQHRAALVHATLPVSETDLGRALIYLTRLITDSDIDTLLAADYALNPFAGMWYGAAFFSDKTHRGNRLIDADEVLTDIAGHANQPLQGIIGLFEEGNTDTAFDTLEIYLKKRFAGQALYVAIQEQVLAQAKTLCVTARAWNIPWYEALATLSSACVTIHAQTGESPDVIFTTLEGAAHEKPAGIDTVVIGNLNAETYPVRDPEGALQTLLKKWRAAPVVDALKATRRTFARAIAVASSTVVIERSLHNDAADEAPAAVTFEEALACYRESLVVGTDIDPATKAPNALPGAHTVYGEQHLIENAFSQSTTQTVPNPNIGSVSPEAHSLIVLPRQYGKRDFPGLDLSASQIESYMECPYRWFAQRRLKLEGLEEGFGALERGTFMHAVLKRFYEAFQEEVAPKVTQEYISDAEAILRRVFNELAAEQATLRPGERYVPIDSWEEQVRANLLGRLVDALPFEARLLPDFVPWKFEWGYGETEPYRYAGCNILGRIDRIDCDSAGRAVVIDYKSSLSLAYRLHDAKEAPADEPAFVLPRKLQTLIYAKALRDTLGVQVVGALYANPLKQAVLGAYDRHAIHKNEIPFTGANADACGVPCAGINTFNELIDRSEELIAARMQALEQGDISPCPIDKDACAYCPVGNCLNRIE